MRQRPGTTQFRRCRTDCAPTEAATWAPPQGSSPHGTLLIARKPTAPGANGRRNRLVASSWVCAGGTEPTAVKFVVVIVFSGSGWDRPSRRAAMDCQRHGPLGGVVCTACSTSGLSVHDRGEGAEPLTMSPAAFGRRPCRKSVDVAGTAPVRGG